MNRDWYVSSRDYGVISIIDSSEGKRKIHISRIMKLTGLTLSHLVTRIRKLSDCGMILKEKEGRKVYLSLSKKGRKFCDAMRVINEVFDDKS